MELFNRLFGFADPAPFVEPKVLVINYDPVFGSKGGKRLHEVREWNDPHKLTEGYIAEVPSVRTV